MLAVGETDRLPLELDKLPDQPPEAVQVTTAADGLVTLHDKVEDQPVLIVVALAARFIEIGCSTATEVDATVVMPLPPVAVIV